jgi:hypothetical protein
MSPLKVKRERLNHKLCKRRDGSWIEERNILHKKEGVSKVYLSPTNKEGGFGNNKLVLEGHLQRRTTSYTS